jgi:Zn-dependent protease
LPAVDRPRYGLRMSWSLRVARVAGIDIRVHFTFLLIILWGASQWQQHGVRGMAFGVALVLLLFLCVTLHELGHSVVAQRFGITVRQIVLLPIGGVAMLSRMPSKPSQELLVALAGPVVNVVIAAALALGLGINFATGRLTFPELAAALRVPPSGTLLVLLLLNANVWLVLFNLIPAFPLDGGRVLRAVLAMNMHPARATRVAAGIGQVLAVLLGTFGLVTGNWMWVLIAIFIFFGAGAESGEGMARTVLQTRRVGDAYNKHALTLAPHDRLSTVIDHLLTSYQPDFAVLGPRGGPLGYGGPQLLGVVTRNDVVRSLQSDGRDAPVDAIMHRDPLRVPAAASLEDVRQALSEHEKRVAAVYDGSAFLGLVSAEDIAEAYAVLRFIDGGIARQREEGGVVV